MIKCLLVIQVLFSFIYALDTPIIIHTPEGMPLTAYIMGEQSLWYNDEMAQDDIDWLGLDAQIIDPTDVSYNCHGYAWSKSEDMGTYWIGLNPTGYDYETNYFSDYSMANDNHSSYTYTTSDLATHSCYEPAIDHSTRVIQNNYPVCPSGNQTHVSKWACGPLVRHAPGHDPFAEKWTNHIHYYKLKTFHTGTLSNYPKTWIGAGNIVHSLTGDTEVPTGVTLTIKDESTVNLSTFSLTSSGGTIVLEQHVDINPYFCRKDGSIIKGYYPTCTDALAAASNGETIEFGDSFTLEDDMVIPSGITLRIKEGTTVNISSYSLTTTGGTILVDDNVDINPHYCLKDGTILKGYYPTYTAAINASSSGETIEYGESMTLNDDMTTPSGITLEFTSDATVNLGQDYVMEGSLIIQDGASIIPDDIRASILGSVVGLYHTIIDAMSKGNTVQARGGTHTFTDNYTISSTKGLSLYDNAIVKFPSSKSLNVYGTLSCDKTTFTRTSGTWGGIKYYSGSGGTLDEATITNATYGVYCKSTSAGIVNSDISNCTYGIYNYEAGFNNIKNNNISGSTYDIYCYDSSPIIKNNVISGGTISLYCDHDSWPELLNGGNNFHNNYVTFGVYTDDNSRPKLGNSDCCQPGNNSFVYSMFDIAVIHSGTNCSTLVAQGNWWGAYPVPSGIFSGLVDAAHPLTSAPLFTTSISNPESDLFDQNISFSSFIQDDGGDELINYYDNKWTPEMKINFLTQLFYEGEATGISSLCMEIIETYPETPHAFSALGLMYQIAKKEGISKDFDKQLMKIYLKTFENKVNKSDFIGSALLMLAGLEDEEGLSRIDKIRKDYEGSYVAKYALYKKFMYFYHEAEDLKKTEEVLVQLDAEYPDDRVTFEAHLLMGDNDIDAKTFYTQDLNKEIPEIEYVSSNVSEILPKEYSLEAAYPNPFNPSTTLEYCLPVQSEVECSMYDLSGNLVKEFFFNQYAGTHSITWNADQYSSGIYLLRFTAKAFDGTESFVDYQKVTLLK